MPEKWYFISIYFLFVVWFLRQIWVNSSRKFHCCWVSKLVFKNLKGSSRSNGKLICFFHPNNSEFRLNVLPTLRLIQDVSGFEKKASQRLLEADGICVDIFKCLSVNVSDCTSIFGAMYCSLCHLFKLLRLLNSSKSFWLANNKLYRIILL